jgi:hypothetical protein
VNAKYFWNIANADIHRQYIMENTFDPWIGTPFEGYRHLGNKQKGEYGERLVYDFFRRNGAEVKKPPTSTSGHDIVVNDILVEVKFGLSHTNNKLGTIKQDVFTINHVAIGKDWERLLFIGINSDINDLRAKFMEKDTFIELYKDKYEFNKYFSVQQGGKHGNNDDFISADKKLNRLINSDYMKDISEWFVQRNTK